MMWTSSAAAAAAAGLCRFTLENTERHDLYVLNRRSHVVTGRKLRMLTGIRSALENEA